MKLTSPPPHRIARALQLNSGVLDTGTGLKLTSFTAATVLLAATALPQPGAGEEQQRKSFAGAFWLSLEENTSFVGGTLSLTVDPEGVGQAHYQGWSDVIKPSGSLYDPIVRRALPESRIAVLRNLLRLAQLFEEQSWGHVPDGQRARRTLEIHDGNRYAILVCSGNASFNDGHRKKLLASLLALRDELAAGP